MSAVYRHGFWFKLVLVAALVALADRVFYQGGHSHGWLGLFGAALVLAAGLALPALRHDRRALVALAVALAMAGAMAIDATILPFVLFWVALGLAILLPATTRFDDGWRWAQRLFAHGFKALFGPLIDLFKLARSHRRKPQAVAGLRRTLPALVLPLAGSAVILALFAAANPVIEQFFASLSLPFPDEALFERLFFWSFVSIVVWGVLRPRRSWPFFGTFDGSGDLALPGVSPTSVLLSLIAFNLLFAMQNLMDMAWLWGLVALPQGMTLADYAHRGAYPLIVTALLAALFVLVTLRPGSQTAASPLVRRLVLLWIVQNVVLVASSMLRLYDYIDAYSLTRLRIAALAWMGLVAVGLGLIGWRLLKQKSAPWLINANCSAATLLLCTYAFVDTGAVAAQWNVRHAREVDGTGAGIDLCYLAELGPSALLPLIELESRPLDPVLQQRVKMLREQVQYRQAQVLSEGGWTLLGEYRLSRAASLGAVLPKSPPSPRYDCSGQPYEAAPVS
jgi:hypothetical protein